MNKGTTIKVSDVTIQFRLNNDRILFLEEFMITTLREKLQYNKFTALEHISFELKRGQTPRPTRRNSTGKNTFLEIISGILKPAEGQVSYYGNVAPMLELGNDFNSDLASRESVFLNDAILGYSEEFLKGKYGEIMEFSELGQFTEVPIWNYSSDMFARLVFSIATVVNPDILIVDEILPVGDVASQGKSKKGMLHLMSGGTTILFVSRSIEQAREMYNRTTWLESGSVELMDGTEKVCNAYESK